jgi:hypothetical protein
MCSRAAWLLGSLCFAGCVTPPLKAPPPSGGSVAVQFKVNAPTVPGLILETCSACTIGLDQLQLIGDSATSETVSRTVAIDPVVTSSQTVSLANLPQGVYSQLVFNVEQFWLEGTYMGVPLRVRTDGEGPRVVLRITPPPELVDGNDVSLVVAINADVWWHDVDLSQALLVDGSIIIDALHNWDMLFAITRDMAACFTLARTNG